MAIFFGISGYLVTTSFRRGKNRVVPFLTKRALRIFPALIAVAVLSACLIGPFVTTIDLRAYFSSPRTLSYVYHNIALNPQFDLPGVFLTNPFPGAVNGSLWTLPMEFVLYLVVVGFAVVPWAKAHQWISLALAVVAVMLARVIPASKYIVYGTDLYNVFFQAPYFFVGSFLSYRSDWVRQNGGRIVLPLCVALLALYGTPLVQIGAWVVIPCVVILVGEMRSPIATTFARLGDISYGVYLWSFPMQQLAALYLLPRIGPFPAMLSAAVTVLLLAKLSWKTIERPALGLKRNAFLSQPPAS